MDFWLAKPATSISGSGNQVVHRDFLSVERSQRFQLTWNCLKAAAIIIIAATSLILDSLSDSKPCVSQNRKEKTKPTLLIPMNRWKTHSNAASPSSLPKKVRCQYECRDDKPFMVALTAAYNFTHTHLFFQICLSLSRFIDSLTQKHNLFSSTCCDTTKDNGL